MARSQDKRVVAIMAVVAENLRKVRDSIGLTQEQAARKADITVTNLARWERGDHWIDPGNLKLLADVYERPVDHFYLEQLPWLRESDRPSKPRSV